MADQRIKGQEVQIQVTSGSNVEDTLTDIQSFNVTPTFEVKSVGYLFGKSEKKDNIFKGIKFDATLHIYKQTWFAFLDRIKKKSQRITPDIEFNIIGVFFFPSGETPTMMLPDVTFGDQPHTIGSRGDYVTVKLQGECEDWDVVLS